MTLSRCSLIVEGRDDGGSETRKLGWENGAEENSRANSLRKSRSPFLLPDWCNINSQACQIKRENHSKRRKWSRVLALRAMWNQVLPSAWLHSSCPPWPHMASVSLPGREIRLPFLYVCLTVNQTHGIHPHTVHCSAFQPLPAVNTVVNSSTCGPVSVIYDFH